MSEFPDAESEARFAEEHPEEHMRRREFLARTAAMAGLAGLATVLPADTLLSEAAKREARAHFPKPADMPIDNFVILMMENRSFDHYLGWFPGADGKAAGLSYPNATNGKHVKTKHWAPDFQGCGHIDPDHSWEGGRTEWNKGKMNGFLRAAVTDSAPKGDRYAIGYYNRPDLPFLPQVSEAFTLYDRYFCSILAETFPNRYYQWAAQSGGQAHNNIPPEPDPTGAKFETIFDRATAHGLTVAYYYVDQPFAALFGSRAIPWLKPVSQYYEDAATGNLPNIAIVDPPFSGEGQGTSGDEHPHGDIRYGQTFMSEAVHAFLDSPNFHRGAMFVNYDEWGGFFDHVPPRLVPDQRERSLPIDSDTDKGPPFFGITGFRVPGVAISPYARRGHVSHQAVTHESILKMISYRFRLGYLNKRHRYASNIARSFDWGKANYDVPDLPTPVFPPGPPCPSASSKSGSSEREAEIGSPAWNRYIERLGFDLPELGAADIYPRASKSPGFVEAWERYNP
jgi:phospholipase C